MKTTILALSLLILFTVSANAQTEKHSSIQSRELLMPLSGTYKVVSGSTIEEFEITGNKIAAKEKGEIVEKFFVWYKDGDDYIVEKVDVNTEQVDFSENKDRFLLRIKIQELEKSKKLLSIDFPHGVKQEIVIE